MLTSGARPGDIAVLTKGIAVEGTSVLAREAEPALLAAGLEPEALDRGKDLLFLPGISVVRDAAAARAAVKVRAMHDPTEGGLATGLLEVAVAANVGVLIEADSVPVLPETEAFCRALGLDPFGLIASGALLAAVAPEDVRTLLDALEKEGIAASEIGRFTPPEDGLKLRTSQGVLDLPRFERDELARFFGS